MKRKKALIILALVIALAVPFSVFAATSDTPAAKTIRGFFGIDISKLSDKQKADITDYTKKMADLQKEFINNMVDNGTMTKEQGDAAISQIDKAIESGNIGSFLKGFGKGGFEGRGKGGFEGRGQRGGMDFAGMDLSKLTDKQKADLKDSYKKIAELQKQYVSTTVANGLLTKEQGDAAAKKVDELIKAIEEGSFTKGMGMMMGRFGSPGFFGMGRIDPSKLTDKQKADLDEFTKNLTELQKEMVNKMVANGAITKEQGDSAIQRIDDMSKFSNENGFFKGMGRGKFGGHGFKGDFGAENEALPTT